MYLHRTRRRSGFTLVELIVAAGLTILIMSVLATGFQVGLQSLSQLKSAGDLADRIRTAETMLRLDLDAPHFDPGTFLQPVAPGVATPLASSNPGTIRVSDLRFDLDPTIRAKGGFFQIRQQGSTGIFEGLDQDQLFSTSTQSHALSMTVRRSGKTSSDLFMATDANMATVLAAPANLTDVAVIANTYASPWAEVHWFLDTTRPTIQNGVTTFPLCRRVLLLTNTSVAVTANSSLAEVISSAGGVSNTINTITPQTSLISSGATPTSLFNSPNNRAGDDIVITNVVSFEVKPTWSGPATANPRFGLGAVPAAGTPLPTTPGNAMLNADYPYDILPNSAGAPPAYGGGTFDTTQGGIPLPGGASLPIRVTGVQIKIRVYDSKNQITRQSVVTSKL